jgi:cytochrome c peroxidase
MKKTLIIGMVASLALVFLQATTFRDEPKNKAELGRLLFFDPILSKDKTISCGSCHREEFAFADTVALSVGVNGRKGKRNTPTSMNMLFRRPLFWDGRSNTLEEQALEPIKNPDEMNLPLDEAVLRLQKHKRYKLYFQKIFNSPPNESNLAEAIASFERTLETSESAFDEWKFTDNPAAVSEAVKRGFIIFNDKGKCVKCHFGQDLALNEFRNIGLFNGHALNDSGRAVVTRKTDDIGKFKIASLRNVAITAPYMHNGMFRTLAEVIDFYNEPQKIVPDGMNRDSLLQKPLGLTKEEKDDLESFLLSLTDKRFEKKKH